MKTSNKVFIATSIDGYISDRNGGIDWLSSIPNPDGIDMGYQAFMDGIDAIVMGRKTFETVCNFDIDWPYSKPVFVLSNSLNSLAAEYQDKTVLIKGELQHILQQLHQQGYHHLYIDGGKTIQSFLAEDLIDEMIITTIPIMLGGGDKLFAGIPQELDFALKDSKIFLNRIVQSHYQRIR